MQTEWNAPSADAPRPPPLARRRAYSRQPVVSQVTPLPKVHPHKARQWRNLWRRTVSASAATAFHMPVFKAVQTFRPSAGAIPKAFGGPQAILKFGVRAVPIEGTALTPILSMALSYMQDREGQTLTGTGCTKETLPGNLRAIIQQTGSHDSSTKSARRAIRCSNISLVGCRSPILLQHQITASHARHKTMASGRLRSRPSLAKGCPSNTCPQAGSRRLACRNCWRPGEISALSSGRSR